MRIPPRATPRSRTVRLGLTGVLAISLTAAMVAPEAADAATISASSSTKLSVTWRGNGHGHGMSQYGARGAAMAGKSFRQIIAFYYPHTVLSKPSQPAIRVLLADFGSTTTVAPSPGIRVSSVPGLLPTRGIARYRLIADAHSGLTLQQLRSGKGKHWRNYRTGLADQSYFIRSAGHSVRLYAPDGSSNLYRAQVRAVRRSATGAHGVDSVNVVGLERYTAGVTPREMPASWSRAAVDAQAIAVRTYAMYALEHPRNRNWDICDTTACQFYGGNAYISAKGKWVWRDSVQGVRDTDRLVATYRGKPIFAQFSASDGGWTVAGGQPYLVARADPYDNTRSGDPYLAVSHSVSTASVARYYGLSKLTQIAAATDGKGAWGGRTTGGYVYGIRHGKPVKVHTTGYDLQTALGAWTNWFRVVAR